MSFLEELKRRKVFRVAASYAVVAFIIMQLVEIVFPIFDFPQWTSQFVIILVLIGFPISVILSWVFDRTPQGYIKTESKNKLVEETDAILFLISLRFAISYQYCFAVSLATSFNTSKTSSVSFPNFNSKRVLLCFLRKVSKKDCSNTFTLSTGTFLNKFFDPA